MTAVQSRKYRVGRDFLDEQTHSFGSCSNLFSSRDAPKQVRMVLCPSGVTKQSALADGAPLLLVSSNGSTPWPASLVLHTSHTLDPTSEQM